MKLVFVNIMQELQRFDSTAYITQPPVPLAILNAATPKSIETALIDEQADAVRFEGDVFAFSVSTQNASAVYDMPTPCVPLEKGYPGRHSYHRLPG